MRPILSNLGLVTVGDETAWAVTSQDDRYRYVLGRMWDDYFSEDPFRFARPLWVYGMLNPSKARGRDATGKVVDDLTVRKCEGFAKRGGAGGFLVVNVLARSETDPDELVSMHLRGEDVRGEHNAAALAWALSRPALAGRNIAAWGVIPKPLRDIAKSAEMQFRQSASECLGLTAEGFPRHPSRLGYSTPIVRF